MRVELKTLESCSRVEVELKLLGISIYETVCYILYNIRFAGHSNVLMLKRACPLEAGDVASSSGSLEDRVSPK